MKMQLKHVGYGLLLATILFTIYYYSTLAVQREAPLAPGNFKGDWGDEEHVFLFEMIAGNRYISTSHFYALETFIVTMLDAIAVALSLALIVHPANKK